jgi:hypothetical protein
MSQVQLKQLENVGLGRIGVRPEGLDRQPRTIVVVGPGRSGTSMVAGALHELGVFLGKHAASPIFEDSHLDQAIDRDEARLSRLLDEYNQRYPIWAYKRPQVAIEHLERIHEHFRNPIYVCCFRDVFAVANRNRISAGSDLLEAMRGALDAYRKVLAFLAGKRPYSLLVSYDKASRDKGRFLDELGDFCGLEMTEERRAGALAFITDSPREYLAYSEKTKDLPGFLDSVSLEAVRGWAKPKHGRPVEVVLYIGGREVARTRADRPRKDLAAGDAQTDPRCGFELRGFDPALIQAGAEIRVKAEPGGLELVNSPLLVDSRRSEECPGFLDTVTARSVSGWAKSAHGCATEVVLYIDGAEIARTVADNYRPDLEGQQCYRPGCCGFDFGNLDRGLLAPGAEVRVKTAGASVELINSPFVVQGI